MRKLVVFLPRPESSGRTAVAKHLLESLRAHPRVSTGEVRLVIGVPDKFPFGDLLDRDDLTSFAEVRDFQWTAIPGVEFKSFFRHPSLIPPKLLCPSDRGYGFRDCHMWAFLEPFENEWPAPAVPYVCFAPAFEEYTGREPTLRRSESPFSKQRVQYYQFLRRARKVFVTGETDASALAHHIGLLPHSIASFPYPYAPLSSSPSSIKIDKGPYFVWGIDGSLSNDHLFVLRAIEQYYTWLGGSITTLVLGSPNERWHENHGPPVDFSHPYWKVLRDVAGKETLNGRVVTIGEPRSVGAYYELLKSALFLLHFKRSGGISASLMDASAMGVPILCSDYPCARSSMIGTSNVTYFDSKKINELELADLIAAMPFEDTQNRVDVLPAEARTNLLESTAAQILAML